MGLVSKYTNKEIAGLSKKEFMREATYDDIFTDFGKTLNVLIMARESTAHVDQKKALHDQVERLSNLVKSKAQFHLVSNGIIIEDGKSGLSAEARPHFVEAIDRATIEDIDIILVQEASRFSRNIGEFFSYMQILQNNDVGLLILEGEFWTYHMPPADYPRLASEVSKGQAESLTTSKRVNRGIDTYRDRGQLVQGDMFGYDLKKAVDRKDNTYMINSVDGATVQLIFDLYVNKGMGTDLIATHLNIHHYPTCNRNGEWSASKVRRVLMNEKYMGYIMYGKFKIIDTNTKKKIATHIEAIRETIYAEDGKTVLEECNLTKGNWEPLVDEDTWWKAQEIRKKRSREFINSSKGALKTGKRSSNDAYANKAYCECGYTLSPQYAHAATETEPAHIRYHCRQQMNAHTPRYREMHGLPPAQCTCSLCATSDVAMRLMSIKVFEHLFSDIKDSIEDTIKILELANEKVNSGEGASGVSIEELQTSLKRLNTRLDGYIDMRALGEITEEQYRSRKENTEKEIAHVEELIRNKKLEESKRQKYKLDVNKIRDRLETFVDLEGYGVSNEMIEFFLERIVRRSGDEFVWEMNLSGLPSIPNKYKIKEYSEEHSSYLKDDKNFNIVETFVISLEECEKFCREKAKRGFRKKFWNQITVKIAVK